MMNQNMIIEELTKIVGEDGIRINEPMSRHTTFRIGGPAQIYLEPELSQVKEVMDYCRNHDISCTVIGNGSNLLVGDGGILGVVLSFGRRASAVKVDGCHIHAEAGALLSALASKACEAGLTGLEFAAGIPGSVGGAVVMNAGAYGGEIADVITSAEVLTEDGQVETWTCEDLQLSYRSSRLMRENALVLSAAFQLAEGDQSMIRGRMEDLRRQRISKQPLEYPSAGSTFKRPEGYFAGKLIMDAGLRGYRVGDAQVAEKHCGFVVNRGQATAAQVRQLMEDVTLRVKETSGVTLEPEVRMIGEFL